HHAGRADARSRQSADDDARPFDRLPRARRDEAMTFGAAPAGARPRTLEDKIKRMHWGIITVLCALAAFGVVMHLSAADGSWSGRPLSHGLRFLLVLVITFGLAMLDVRFWLAIAYPLYALAFLMLVGVEVAGSVHMGAQRWLDFGPISL